MLLRDVTSNAVVRLMQNTAEWMSVKNVREQVLDTKKDNVENLSLGSYARRRVLRLTQTRIPIDGASDRKRGETTAAAFRAEYLENFHFWKDRSFSSFDLDNDNSRW